MDGKLLNQDASAKDYQKQLENNILKLNHRSFTQVVILGSSSFIPFMQLTAAARREVVEEILDIKVFSLMNYILKSRIKDNKESSRDIKYENDMLEHKVTLQENKISEAKDKSKTSLKALEKKMKKNADDMKKLENEVVALKGLVTEWETDILPKHEKVGADRTELNRIKYRMEHKSNKAEQEIKFFNDNDNCPTCEQHIDEEFKHKAIEERTDKMVTGACAMVSLDAQLTEMGARIDLYEKIENDKRENEVSIAKKNTSVESLGNFNEDVSRQINDIQTAGTLLAEDKTRLQSTVKIQNGLRKRKKRSKTEPTTSTLRSSCFRTRELKPRSLRSIYLS
jgi:DNA repair exonuclease SbcCD ATPase subunit